MSKRLMSKRSLPKKVKKPGKAQKAVGFGTRGGSSIVFGNPLANSKLSSAQAIGIPQTQRVLMRYSETFTVVSTTGVLGSYKFAANGLYDPNLSVSGHQPYGFDQWMSFYSKATVLKSRIDMEVGCTGSDSTLVGVAFAVSDPTSVLGGSAEALVEGNRGTAGLCVDYAAPRHFEAVYSLNTVDPDHDPAAQWNTTGANPTNTNVYFIHVQCADFTSTSTAFISAVIEYEVLLQDPITLAKS